MVSDVFRRQRYALGAAEGVKHNEPPGGTTLSFSESAKVSRRGADKTMAMKRMRVYDE
jgi:hypothetical protein